MAVIDDLIQARANIAANIKALTANPKPTYSIDGKSYSWTELLNSYVEQEKKLKELIQLEESPWEVRSRADV